MGSPVIKNAVPLNRLKRAFPIKKESSYGVAIGNADLTKRIAMEGLSPFYPKTVKYTDDELIGKGYEHRTKSEVLEFTGEYPAFVFQSNPLTDGLFWALALGGYSVSEIDAGKSYLHKITMASLAENPVPKSITGAWEYIKKTTPAVVERYKTPGEVVKSIEVTLDRRELAKMSVTLQSSGEMAALDGGYNFPSLSALHYYPAESLDVQIGPMGGALRSLNEVIHQVTIRCDVDMDDRVCKYPGGPVQTGGVGMVDGIQIVTGRVVTVEFQIVETEDYWWSKFCANEPMKAQITCRSRDLIPDTANKFYTRFLFSCLDPEEMTDSAVNKLLGKTLRFRASVFSSATEAAMLTVAVLDDTAEYLVAAT